MTLREFYVAVAEANVNDELTEKAEDLIEKHDASLEKKRAKAAEKKVDNSKAVEFLKGILTDEYQTATDLAEKMDGNVERTDGKAVTRQWVSTLMRGLIGDGVAEKAEVKVEGKKGKCVAYKLV